jgi:two-component system response regulator AtoC
VTFGRCSIASVILDERMSKDALDVEPTTAHGDAERGGLQVLAFGDGWSSVHDVQPGTTELIVGRDADCALRLDDKSVSRRHLALGFGTAMTVRDLGSSNGVEVDGVRLAPRTEVPLAFGARVRLGNVSLVVYGETIGQAREEIDDELSDSDPMKEVHALCDRVAGSELSVLFLGETGTGKELLAERVHARSARASGPFVRLNAATVPESLAESQLFGHERGAFTGAQLAKDGLIAAAHRGTLLLDEIGDLSAAVQTKLLRVVETGSMYRVGASTVTTADVRYLAATSRDVGALVASGALRSDLVYRLAGVTVYVPALRERPMAIVPLARKLLAASSGGRVALTPAAERALLDHSWPGNVRELKATMHRASVLADAGRVEPAHLALGALRIQNLAPDPQLARPTAAGPTLPPSAPSSKLRDEIHAVERERILSALEACGGNQTRAAQLLGISRRTLGTKLDQINHARPRKSPR